MRPCCAGRRRRRGRDDRRGDRPGRLSARPRSTRSSSATRRWRQPERPGGDGGGAGGGGRVARAAARRRGGSMRWNWRSNSTAACCRWRSSSTWRSPAATPTRGTGRWRSRSRPSAARPTRGPLTRSGARPGDRLLVTGALGGSILGRHLRVEPRVREALLLHERYELHAGMDISDGLALDASRLAAASGCGVALDLAAIPISADALRLAATTGPHAARPRPGRRRRF